MKPKKSWQIVSVISILALIGGIATLIVPAKPVQAATINVPVDYATIQAAIDAANPGDTINVAAGTYNLTSSIRVNKSISIIGDTSNPENVVINAGTIPVNSGPIPPDRDKDGFQVSANNVVIRGFKIINAVNVPSGAGDGWQNAAITVGGDITLIDWLNPWNVPLLIDGGTFSNNIIEDCTYGIYLAMSKNVTVSNNTIRDCDSGIMNWNTKYWKIYQDPTGNTIEGNLIEDCGNLGICLGAWGERFSVNGTIIRNNTILNSQKEAGIALKYIDGPLMITGNQIHYNPDGILSQYSTNILVHYNSIVCNTNYGINNVDTYIIDAINNWWGCNDGPGPIGPGSGQKISINVLYNPWLVLNLSRTIPMGGSPTIIADMTDNSNGVDSGGWVPDGTPIIFTTSQGSMIPATATTTNGIASSTSTTAYVGIAEASAMAPTCYECVTTFIATGVPPPGIDQSTGEATSTTMRSPQMKVNYLKINPSQARANQPITISANVANEGSETGSTRVALKINGQIEQTKMVTVGGGGSRPVTFTVTKAEPGTYTVVMGSQRASFVVNDSGATAEPSVSQGTIVLLIAGFVLVMFIIIVAFAFRRRPSY